MRLSRLVPIAAAAVVGSASFVLSFVAQRDVAAELGAFPAHLAWLGPVVVDGAVIAASASLASQSKRDRVAMGLLVACLGLSVVVNVRHAATPNALGWVLAGAPPLVLLACIELAVRAGRQAGVPAVVAPVERPKREPRVATAPVHLRTVTGTGKAAIVAAFQEHVTAGGDPRDRQLAGRIASSTGAPLGSVRRVLGEQRRAG